MLPQQITESIWSELHHACSDKLHAWRTPVLATVDASGYPCARTVVLRAVDAASQQLFIYTDRRSPKIQELLHCKHAEIVFWNATLNWQLRAKAEIEVLTQGNILEQAWENIKHSTASTDYLRNQHPGAVINHSNDTSQTTQEHQLCILAARVLELDWLELSRNGNRRLRIKNNQAEWLVP